MQKTHYIQSQRCSVTTRTINGSIFYVRVCCSLKRVRQMEPRPRCSGVGQRFTGVYWCVRRCEAWQPILRLIPVGVHPCTQGDCCGPSGAGFNHNSPIYTNTHTLQKHKTHKAYQPRLPLTSDLFIYVIYFSHLFNYFFAERISFTQSDAQSSSREKRKKTWEACYPSQCFKPHQKNLTIRFA